MRVKRETSTLWITGLSGAGKSTLACAVADVLTANEVSCRVLDGDLVRRGLCSDLGFSRADRRENIRRVAQRCRELNEEGIWAIAALISPYCDDREMARRIVGDSRFVEVYLTTPLAVCEQRDAKGLYRRARSGELEYFTGVSDPYEPPPAADLSLDTSALPLRGCTDAILDLIQVVTWTHDSARTTVGERIRC